MNDSTLQPSLISGRASFDGLEIKTDSITDPRRDRVLPIMDEEQIFMCRQMVPLLKNEGLGLAALDVGTGSGVFAIWAAKYGCRVLAIDINPRAIRMARENARTNNIPVYSEWNETPSGAICLMHRRFGEGFASEHRFVETFDMVFLNPPYNPTCPGIRVALHAESGKDGQHAFREQLPLVPRVLRRGGWCIGNQMTCVAQEEPEGIGLIKHNFGSCLLRWTYMLNEQMYPTELFLRGQYAAYLDPNSGFVPSAARVQRYVRNVSGQCPSFGLIYYEIKRGVSRDAAGVHRIRRCFRPAATWQNRIWLHRQIVRPPLH